MSLKPHPCTMRPQMRKAKVPATTAMMSQSRVSISPSSSPATVSGSTRLRAA